MAEPRYPAEDYDLMHGELDHDLAYWVRLARAADGPVLELGCGTGRVLLPVAEAGVEVVGLDADPGMLARLRAKLRERPAAVRRRVRLVRGDMRRFRIDRRFALIYVPFRAFLHMLTPGDQEAALARVRAHLAPGGRLALACFDPVHDLLSEREHRGILGAATRVLADRLDARTGQRLVVSELRRELLYEEQVLRELWCFERFDRRGRSRRRVLWPLSLRWIFPQEMRHLLRLAGFEVVSLHGGFEGEAFRHGCEQVWVARRRD